MNRTPIAAVATSALAFALPLLSGCGGGGAQQSQQLTEQDRSKLLAPRDDFEAGKNVPIAADTYFAAGQLAEGQGKLDQAVQQYEKTLKLSPKHRDALFRSGVVLVKQRKLVEAIEVWNRYVAVTGGDATAYANLGFAFELAGRTTEAEQAYQKGVRRDPANAACRVNYGLMLARKERFNEALLQLQTVLTDAEVQYNLASVYESLGRKEQAKIAYRKALTSDPRMKDAEARLDALQ
jgi:tetratricopeptide (TPR) repeat protein